MAYLVTNIYGCSLIFDEKPVRVGIKKVPCTMFGAEIKEDIEIPIYSDRETWVPGSVMDIFYGGPSAKPEEFTNWAVIGPECTGTPFYDPLETGIIISQDSAKSLNGGKEQTFYDNPLEI